MSSREATWPRMVTRAGGWLLLICCAVLLMTAVAVGERPTSYAQLRAAVQDGDVDEVTVAGGSTPPGRGRYEVEVHWNAGLVRRVSTVVEARSSGPFGRVTGDSRTVVPSVEEDLGSFREGIAVERGTEYTGYSETFGWRLPQWAGPLGLVVWLGTFVALVIGPPPWRANRWAWFWMLVFASPVGLVAFLVLGGPTGLLPADPSRPRLRGGWGLVLAAAGVPVEVRAFPGLIHGFVDMGRHSAAAQEALDETCALFRKMLHG